MKLQLGLVCIAFLLREYRVNELGLPESTSGNGETNPKPFENGIGRGKCVEERQAVLQERVSNVAAQHFPFGIDCPPPILLVRH